VLFANLREPSAIRWHIAQFPVCHEGPEWHERGQEKNKAELEFPAVGQLGMEQAQTVQDKEDAMRHSAVPDIDFLIPNVLHWHGNPKKQEVRNALKDSGDAKPSNYCG
jgi:hypothetical protein